MVKKIIPYNVAIKSTSTKRSYDIPKAYTNDLNSVEFQFTLTDVTEAELSTATANVLLYMRDGSFFENNELSGVTIDGTVVKYTLKSNEGNHSGVSEAQVEIIYDGEPDKKLASQKYQFEIITGLDMEVAVEIVVKDWTALTTEARNFIDNATVEVNALKGELQGAIDTANTNLTEFDVALQNGIVAANLAEKLENFEEINDSRLLSAEQQLADNKNIQHSKRRPLVTFITDDGKAEDWTKLKPLSETYGVPFTAALIANNQYMTQEQVLYLQNTLGWEIASHTANHVALAGVATEAEIELECRDAKTTLISRGYNVKNIVYPYGSHDERVRRIAKKYYNCGVSVSSGLLNTGVVSSFILNRYALGSAAIAGQNTATYYKSLVDSAVTNNAWLIFMLHPGAVDHDATQQAYLEETIQYIQSLNVDIVNLQDGYDVFGNAFESGDYTGGATGLAISKDAQQVNFPNNFQVISKTGINNASPVTAFPKGVVSSVAITIADAAGFPTSGGTLITFRLNTNDDYSFQLWTHVQSHLLYKRTCAAGVWQAWDYYVSSAQMTTAITNDRQYITNATVNAYSASQLITDYPTNKITTHYYNASGQTGWPASTAGIVTTYKIGGNGWYKQEVRGYNTNSVWSRYATSADGSWSAWEKISAV